MTLAIFLEGGPMSFLFRGIPEFFLGRMANDREAGWLGQEVRKQEDHPLVQR